MYIPNVQSILAAGLALTGMPEMMKKRELLSPSKLGWMARGGLATGILLPSSLFPCVQCMPTPVNLTLTKVKGF
jgi:hypothetical protein